MLVVVRKHFCINHNKVIMLSIKIIVFLMLAEEGRGWHCNLIDLKNVYSLNLCLLSGG